MIYLEMISDELVVFACTFGLLTFGPYWAGKALAKGMKAYKREMGRDPH